MIDYWIVMCRECDKSTKNPKKLMGWDGGNIKKSTSKHSCEGVSRVSLLEPATRTNVPREFKHKTEFDVRLVGADESEKCDIGL